MYGLIKLTKTVVASIHRRGGSVRPIPLGFKTESPWLYYMKTSQNIPEHIAIIMDGNGRWAKKRHLPVQLGHRAGMEALHRIVEAASDMGIKVLTVYAFSTENWKRSKEEVGYLMDLAVEYFIKEIDELDRKNVKVRLIGNRERLPKRVRDAALEMEERTKGNTGLFLQVALNYGGRADIVQAVQKIIDQNEETVTEEMITENLYTAEVSDPDVLVRTGGEKRLSNFLLWQNSYAELIFTDDWWPDCDKAFLERIVKEYQKRNRRYGGRK